MMLPTHRLAIETLTSLAGMDTMRLVLAGILQSMRPHQWVKNVFVLAPLVFAGHLVDPSAVIRAAAAAALFCALSGAVYLVNDCLDVEADRRHPTKRYRPIAAGKVTVRAARTVSAVLGPASLLAAFVLAPGTGLALVGYLAMNLAYSYKLKHVAYVDVGVIAAGFLLRVVAGGAAIDVALSWPLLACTFLLASYLGFGKRRHELLQAGVEAAAQRGVLRDYRLNHVTATMLGIGLSTTAAYTAWAMSAHARDIFASDWGWTTVPFLFIGLTRFFSLTSYVDEPSSPTDRLVRDPVVLGTVAGWGAVVIALLYIL
jgi:decaprenyl-phosphate phosphoribosyltransferase